jgi:HlyD family secretion protein
MIGARNAHLTRLAVVYYMCNIPDHMSRSTHAGRAVDGIRMDQPLPRRRANYPVLAAGTLAAAVGLLGLWQLLPRGLQVEQGELRIATVERGLFRNDVLVRATAAPLHTVMLDALESGRVEEVLVSDGALVEQGQLLFRLSNPQLRLNLVAREADRAQQISNLSLLRVDLESSQTQHQRRLLDLEFERDQARKLHGRYESLAREGVIAARTLEESGDQVAKLDRAHADEQSRAAVEMRIKRDGIRQMEQAVERLDAGLNVVNDSIEGLAVRAPIAGRLTDFHLQLGEIIKPEQRIARIDDPAHFKLVASVDEYFLGRVAVGKRGVATAGETYPIEISRVFPQVTEGRFSIELLFVGEAPAGMNPGQSAETRLTLGESSAATLLPNDAWLNDSGGAWVFVVEGDGAARAAERRAIRVGRRNNSQVEIAAGLKPGERVVVSSYSRYREHEYLRIQ